MKYTIGEAAKATGKSKATISKAIKEGKISAIRQGKTNTSPFAIDASELFRVFSPPIKENTTTNEREHQDKHQENSGLAVEVKMLREALDVQKSIADREREISDDLRKQLERALSLLAPPTQAATPSLWQRLFGK